MTKPKPRETEPDRSTALSSFVLSDGWRNTWFGGNDRKLCESPRLNLISSSRTSAAADGHRSVRCLRVRRCSVLIRGYNVFCCLVILRQDRVLKHPDCQCTVSSAQNLVALDPLHDCESCSSLRLTTRVFMQYSFQSRVAQLEYKLQSVLRFDTNFLIVGRCLDWFRKSYKSRRTGFPTQRERTGHFRTFDSEYFSGRTAIGISAVAIRIRPSH